MCILKVWLTIQLDVENGGYQTCKLLHQQILNKEKTQFNVFISPLEITERSSTLLYNISDLHIRNILNFIDENYMNDISMDKIFELVPLSRRSVELRFKKATGMTIYQHLLSVRVEHLAYLLRTTDRPYVDLAYEVGFRDINNVSRTFRKYKDCTPLEYRRQFSVMNNNIKSDK